MDGVVSTVTAAVEGPGSELLTGRTACDVGGEEVNTPTDISMHQYTVQTF